VRPTRSEHEALKAIYRATSDGGVAPTGDLAQALGLTPGTVTALLKRLADRGLADYTPYRGVELTEAGRRAAVGAIRRHRVVERFLADMLGYPWHDADRLAGTFEYELPDEVEERLFVALDRPEVCPHGFPIPAREVDDIPSLPALTTLETGEEAVVAVPGSTQPDVVAFLETLGLRPGVRVQVRERHPFDGPLVLRVDGAERAIGFKLASQIYVHSDESSSAEGEPTHDPRPRR
jgi:DtxR family Mn-dependent transcriptional regulator